MLDPIEV